MKLVFTSEASIGSFACGCLNRTSTHVKAYALAVKAQQWNVVKLLKLMLTSSASVVALAKKMTKPDTQTITHKISIPKTKVIKQPVQQASKPAANDAVRTAIKPITPQKPLSNQQSI